VGRSDVAGIGRNYKLAATSQNCRRSVLKGGTFTNGSQLLAARAGGLKSDRYEGGRALIQACPSVLLG